MMTQKKQKLFDVCSLQLKAKIKSVHDAMALQNESALKDSDAHSRSDAILTLIVAMMRPRPRRPS